MSKRNTKAYLNKISDDIFQKYQDAYAKITEKAKDYGVKTQKEYTKEQFLTTLNAYKNTLKTKKKIVEDKITGEKKKVRPKHYTYEELAVKVAEKQYYKYSLAQAKKYKDIMNIEAEVGIKPKQQLELLRMKGLDEITKSNIKSDAADLRRKHRMFLEGKATDQEWGKYDSAYIADFIAREYFGSE